MKLNDGSVLPSVISQGTLPSAKNLIQNAIALKPGIVTAIYYTDDEKNLSKKEIEYDVAVSEISHGSTTISNYRNCKAIDLFGMSNNNQTQTYQPDKDDGVPKNGSCVLVLCANGRPDGGNAFIIGGHSHPGKTKHTKDMGQFYEFNFNGINININKEGEYSLTFNTPIDAKGKKKDEKAAGTSLKIDKTGKLKISDNENQSWEIDRVAQKSQWTNGAETIVIDKKNKKVELQSSGELSTKSKKSTSIESEDKINVKAKADMSVSAGNLSVEAKSVKGKSSGNWEIQASGNVQVKAGGNVQVTAGGQAQLKGSQTLLGEGTTPVALVGSMGMGIGNLGAPVSITIIQGSSTVLAGT